MSIGNLCSLCRKVHVFAWLLTVNTMAETSEAPALGMFIWAERGWRWNRDTSTDLWKEPPLYRCCSPSGTNTIWMPLARQRRPHTCTPHRKHTKSSWYEVKVYFSEDSELSSSKSQIEAPFDLKSIIAKASKSLQESVTTSTVTFYFFIDVYRLS